MQYIYWGILGLTKSKNCEYYGAFKKWTRYDEMKEEVIMAATLELGLKRQKIGLVTKNYMQERI